MGVLDQFGGSEHHAARQGTSFSPLAAYSVGGGQIVSRLPTPGPSSYDQKL
jgi:hypothetical protein